MIAARSQEAGRYFCISDIRCPTTSARCHP
jgi:hypothetical protein